MGLKFWYIIDGYHIFQTRKFSFKTNLQLLNYEVFRFQQQFGPLPARVAPKASSYHVFLKKLKIAPSYFDFYEHTKL